jgi:hypothetical protein
VREPLDSHGSRCSTVGTQAAGFTSSTGSSCCHYGFSWPVASVEQRSPFGPAPLQSLHPYYGPLRPCAPHRYSRPRGFGRLRLLPLHRSDRFSRSVQVDHRHCRPTANETVLGLRRAVGTEVVHWLGANKPAYKLDPGFLEHPRLSPRAVIGPGARFLDFLFTGAPRRRRSPGGRDGAVASTMLRS